MKNNIPTSTHHLVPQSRGGSNSQKNLIDLNHNFHVAFHRIFANRTPVEQFAMIRAFNTKVLTRDFHEDMKGLLDTARDEPGYVYKNGVLRKE